jgi:Cu/Ag efflux protein CusF
MEFFVRTSALTVAFLAAAITAGAAQTAQPATKPAVTEAATVSETFVIDAIDYASRLVTLRDADGNTDTIYCGPNVERFDALKVGDKVTFRYYESVVYQIRKPGSAPSVPTDTGAVTRTPGTRPGATIAEQMTATVTVNAIDMKVPSVTFTTPDGRKLSSKVENPKNLEGVKVGDQVEITYTRALAISVTPPSK